MERQKLKTGDRLKCFWNEGYWSQGDVRIVTSISNEGFVLDNHYAYFYDDFRWYNYYKDN